MFRLALALGCTVRELLSRIDARELMEWAVFDDCEPIGAPRSDLQAAIVASTMANCHLPKGKSVRPAEFIPKWWQQPPSLADKGRQMADQLRAWAQQYNQIESQRHAAKH